MIQAGGDVNEQNTAGWTSPHLASMNGHVEVITALLAAGADKTLKDIGGKTPHDFAKQFWHQNCMNALK